MVCTKARMVLSMLTAMVVVAVCGCSDTPTAPARGTCVVDTEPDVLDAPWHLEGPNGYSHSGNGDLTLADMAVGSYTITWGEVAGYLAPPAETREIGARETATFVATYAPVGLPFPESADILMQNFKSVYENMDHEGFVGLIHPNSVSLLQQTTINAFPDLGPDLDVWEERRIHERMSSGSDVTDPLGGFVAGVDSIAFQTFDQTTEWTPATVADPITSGQHASFNVFIVVDRGLPYTSLRVMGAIEFYVASRDSLVDGTTRPYFQVIGQVDGTSSFKAAAGHKAVENVEWGSLKALFR